MIKLQKHQTDLFRLNDKNGYHIDAILHLLCMRLFERDFAWKLSLIPNNIRIILYQNCIQYAVFDCESSINFLFHNFDKNSSTDQISEPF